MSDYDQLSNELTRLGWNSEQGRGDHVKFTKEGIPHIITISRSISNGNRSYMNIVAEIRRWEPKSTIGRPTQSKDRLQSEEQSSQNPEPSEEQLKFIKSHAFIRKGEKVRYVMPEKRDYSKLADDNSVMNVPYIVAQILGTQGVKDSVTSPDDRITIRVNEGHQHSIIVGPDELDSWETISCSGCNTTAPANVSYWKECIVNKKILGILCTECQKKEERLSGILSNMKKLAREFKDGDPNIFKELEEAFDHLPVGASKSDPVITFMTEEMLDNLDIAIDNARAKLEKEAFLKKVRPSKPAKAKKPNLRDAFSAYKEKISFVLQNDHEFSNNDIISVMSDLTYQYGWNRNIPFVSVQMNTKRTDSKLLMDIIIMSDFLLDELKKIYPEQKPAIKISYPAISFEQYITDDPDSLKGILDDEEFSEKCDFIIKTSKLDTDYLKKVISELTLERSGAATGNGLPEQLAEYLTVKKAYLPDRSIAILAAMDECSATDLAEEEYEAVVKTSIKISERIKNETGVDTHVNFLFKNGNACCTVFDEEIKDWFYGRFEYDAFRLKKDKVFGPITVEYEKGELIETIIKARKTNFRDFFLECFDVFYQKTWDDVNKYCEEQDKIRDKIEKETNMEENKNIQNTAKELKDYETNELLRELKARGVKMTGIQVPVTVMQDINLDEL